jgi:hypothetical protein
MNNVTPIATGVAVLRYSEILQDPLTCAAVLSYRKEIGSVPGRNRRTRAVIKFLGALDDDDPTADRPRTFLSFTRARSES